MDNRTDSEAVVAGLRMHAAELKLAATRRSAAGPQWKQWRADRREEAARNLALAAQLEAGSMVVVAWHTPAALLSSPGARAAAAAEAGARYQLPNVPREPAWHETTGGDISAETREALAGELGRTGEVEYP